MIKDTLKELSINLNEEVEETISNKINDLCIQVKQEQKQKDIITCIIILSELNVKEEDLYEILNKYYSIDSRILTKEYIKLGRNIEWPLMKLKSYLKELGYTHLDLIKYIKEHNVREQCKENPLLCELSKEGLKNHFDQQ